MHIQAETVRESRNEIMLEKIIEIRKISFSFYLFYKTTHKTVIYSF